MNKGFIHWISGGIDSYGSITGHAYYENDNDDKACHTPEEKKGTTFRWSVDDQMFMDLVPQNRLMSEEETFRIFDWLIERGWKKDKV